MKVRLFGGILGAVALLLISGCSATGGPTSFPENIQGGAQPTSKSPFSNIPELANRFPDAAELDGWCTPTEAVHLHEDPHQLSQATVCDGVLLDDLSAVVTVSRITGGLDALLDAYALPNEPVDAELVCALPVVDALLVWLAYNAEASYPVYAPADPCGFPQSIAADAYAAVTLEKVATITKSSDGHVTIVNEEGITP
jgi:hypothetical protein